MNRNEQNEIQWIMGIKKKERNKIKWNRMKLSYIIWISLKILMDNNRK